MRSCRDFWHDELGAIVSAELATVGTLVVLGTTVGLSTVATSVDAELNDIARAIRSLDQSYSFRGFSNCRAFTAGSCYQQEDVETSLAALCIGREPAIPDAPAPKAPAPAALTPEPAPISADPPIEEAPASEAQSESNLPTPVPANEKLQ